MFIFTHDADPLPVPASTGQFIAAECHQAEITSERRSCRNFLISGRNFPIFMSGSLNVIMGNRDDIPIPGRRTQPICKIAQHSLISSKEWLQPALKNHFSAEENFSCAGIDHFFRTMGLPPLQNGVYYSVSFFNFIHGMGLYFGRKLLLKNQPENMLNRMLERSIISMISFRKDSSRRLAICLRDPNREIPFSRDGKIVSGDRILISPLEKVRNCSIDKAMNRTRK